MTSEEHTLCDDVSIISAAGREEDERQLKSVLETVGGWAVWCEPSCPTEASWTMARPEPGQRFGMSRCYVISIGVYEKVRDAKKRSQALRAWARRSKRPVFLLLARDRIKPRWSGQHVWIVSPQGVGPLAARLETILKSIHPATPIPLASRVGGWSLLAMIASLLLVTLLLAAKAHMPQRYPLVAGGGNHYVEVAPSHIMEGELALVFTASSGPDAEHPIGLMEVHARHGRTVEMRWIARRGKIGDVSSRLTIQMVESDDLVTPTEIWMPFEFRNGTPTLRADGLELNSGERYELLARIGSSEEPGTAPLEPLGPCSIRSGADGHMRCEIRRTEQFNLSGPQRGLARRCRSTDICHDHERSLMAQESPSSASIVFD